MRHSVRQLNHQLDPVSRAPTFRRRRLGLGDAGIGDFNTWLSDSDFSSNWQQIQGQLTAESGALQDQVLQTGQGLVQQGQAAAQGVVNQAQDTAQQLASQLSSKLDAAKISYVNSYESMLTNGLDTIVTNPAVAARQFVMLGQTIAGQINTVGGLITSLNNPTPAVVVQAASAFTGIMVSLAGIAAGSSVSTVGVGTVICGLIAAAVGLLKEAGLFSGDSSVTPQETICSDVYVDQTVASAAVSIALTRCEYPHGFDPTAPNGGLIANAGTPGGPCSNINDTASTTQVPIGFTVGCIAAYPDDPQNAHMAPGASGWRTFPVPSRQIPTNECPPWIQKQFASKNIPVDQLMSEDDPWFFPIYACGPGPGVWKGAVWDSGHTLDNSAGPKSPNTGQSVPNAWSQSGLRPIDAAFSVYRYLECEMSQSVVTDFQKTFYSAWKANKEYELNGLQSQPDYIVLLHVLRIWNATHAYGTITYITQQESDLTQPYPGTCDPTVPKYYETLVASALSALQIGDPLYGVTPDQAGATSEAALVIHGGGMLSVPLTTSLYGGITSSAAAKVATAVAVTGAAAVAGSVAYSMVSGIALDTLYKGAWNGVKRMLGR